MTKRRARTDQLLSILRDVTSDIDIKPQHELVADLGIDSLAAVELFAQIESRLRVRYETTMEFFTDASRPTVQDLVCYLDRELGPEFPDNGLLCLTERQFVQRYRPEQDADGSFRARDWKRDQYDLHKAVKEHRCWTVITDDDGEICVIYGNQFINRLHQVVTKYPVEDPSWIAQVHGPYDDDEDSYD